MPPSSGPSASSDSAGPKFLDRDRVVLALCGLARRLAERDPRVKRIVLFGSLATNRATIRSDADLLIVLDHHGESPRERIPEYLSAFLDAPVPVDVFPFTEAEIAARRSRGDAFLARVEEQGVLILPAGEEHPPA